MSDSMTMGFGVTGCICVDTGGRQAHDPSSCLHSPEDHFLKNIYNIIYRVLYYI